jgi:hypothetical protein
MVGDRDAEGIRGVGLGRLPDHTLSPLTGHLVLRDLSNLVWHRALGFLGLNLNDGLAGIVPEEFE